MFKVSIVKIKLNNNCNCKQFDVTIKLIWNAKMLVIIAIPAIIYFNV